MSTVFALSPNPELNCRPPILYGPIKYNQQQKVSAHLRHIALISNVIRVSSVERASTIAAYPTETAVRGPDNIRHRHNHNI